MKSLLGSLVRVCNLALREAFNIPPDDVERCGHCDAVKWDVWMHMWGCPEGQLEHFRERGSFLPIPFPQMIFCKGTPCAVCDELTSGTCKRHGKRRGDHTIDELRACCRTTSSYERMMRAAAKRVR